MTENKISVRRARFDRVDASQIAVVNVKAWQAGYAHLLPAAYLEALSIERRSARMLDVLQDGETTVLVSEQGGRIRGFAAIGDNRDDDATEHDAEIYAFYVHPTVWGQGHGAALMAASLDVFRQWGRMRVRLWVLDGNTRAIRFYTRHGFALDGNTKHDIRDMPSMTVTFFERRMVCRL